MAFFWNNILRIRRLMCRPYRPEYSVRHHTRARRTDDKARAEDKLRLDYAEPRIIVQVRAEQQTCLIVMPSAADNLEEEEEEEDEVNWADMSRPYRPCVAAQIQQQTIPITNTLPFWPCVAAQIRHHPTTTKPIISPSTTAPCLLYFSLPSFPYIFG